MNFISLITSREVISAIIGAVVAGIIAFLIQLRSDRSQALKITFSKKIENPLTLAKDDLKNKISIHYQGTAIKTLVFCNLKIINSGKKTIQNQAFSCLFPEGTELLEPPKISTKPSVEVGPVERDMSVAQARHLRFTIGVLGPGQRIEIDFLVTNDSTSLFDIEIGFNSSTGVKAEPGDISGVPTLESQISRTIFWFMFFVITELAAYFLYLNNGIAYQALYNTLTPLALGFAIAGILPLLAALRSMRPVIAAIAKKLQHEPEPLQQTMDVSGTIDSSQIVLAYGQTLDIKRIDQPKPSQDVGVTTSGPTLNSTQPNQLGNPDTP